HHHHHAPCAADVLPGTWRIDAKYSNGERFEGRLEVRPETPTKFRIRIEGKDSNGKPSHKEGWMEVRTCTKVEVRVKASTGEESRGYMELKSPYKLRLEAKTYDRTGHPVYKVEGHLERIA
uniref:RAbetaB-16.1 n=1 Tax=synthetic construct TaxID=32630 RepID=UPI00274030AB|nr:Chain A, RAbetaB-16.1 [synthetic construct]